MRPPSVRLCPPPPYLPSRGWEALFAYSGWPRAEPHPRGLPEAIPALPGGEPGPCPWGTVLATPSDPTHTKCLRQIPRILNPNQGAKKRPLSLGALGADSPPTEAKCTVFPRGHPGPSPGETLVPSPAVRALYSLGPWLLLCSPRRQAAWGEGRETMCDRGAHSCPRTPGTTQVLLAGLRLIGPPARPLSPPG